MTANFRQEGAAIVPFPIPTPLEPDDGSSLHVSVHPDGDGWSVTFTQGDRHQKSIGPMSKETAVGFGAEAVLIWTPPLRCRDESRRSPLPRRPLRR